MLVSYKHHLPYLLLVLCLFFMYRFIDFSLARHRSTSLTDLPTIKTTDVHDEQVFFLEELEKPPEPSPRQQEEEVVIQQHDPKSACRTYGVERNTDRNHNNAHKSFWLNLPQETIQTYKTQWQQFIARETKKVVVPSTKTFHGQGIVLVAGNGDTFSRALTNIRLLRHHGCTLPVEVWHLNDEHPTDAISQAFKKLQAQARDLSSKTLMRPIDQRRSADKQFQIKISAIINAGFQHVLYLDSDNIPTTDPSFLFNHPTYVKTGALFWPDFWKTNGENRIYDVLDVDCQDEWEQESGQMVINKIKSWHPLQLAWYMNHHHDIYYQFLNGDKDTFRFAWKTLNQPFYMNPVFLGMGGTLLADGRFCGHTMIQYPPPPPSAGSSDDFPPLFVHANLLKITDKTHFLHQQQDDGIDNDIKGKKTERPWEWVKRYTMSMNNTWLMPEFYIGMGGRPCMDFNTNQGESQTKLDLFDSLLPGLQSMYFDLGGIGGETRQ